MFKKMVPLMYPVMLEVIVTQVQDYERSYADFCNHFQS